MTSRSDNLKIALVIGLSLLMITTAVVPVFQSSNANSNLSSNPNSTINGLDNPSSPSFSSFAQVPYAVNSISKNVSAPYQGDMNVMVTFAPSNQSRLNSLLENLTNPSSPQYHKYLTKEEFDSAFSPSSSLYENATNYFSGFENTKVTTYQDRLSIVVNAPSSTMGEIFNTTIAKSSIGNSTYFASSAPELPTAIGSHVTQVSGLSNQKIALASDTSGVIPGVSAGKLSVLSTGYPVPINNSGIQYIYGSDLQVAYDEQSLLNVTYPTNEVIATILWAGYNSSNAPVGPFYPTDIYSYYNATLPSYEPHSKVYGVPINGAQQPGISSTYDVSGASGENTLDLEMVGSTAPGSSIYNVYGPNATTETTDAALAFILNPNASFSKLNNVSVISNSWGTPEYNDTSWFTYLQEAQARGITVLASSGDSGDNPASSKYGSNVNYSNDYIGFPSAMAYNNFGVTAVGGDTLTLNANLQIQNETAWYTTANDIADGGPVGSTGGISQVFPEPTWQKSTEANNVIQGKGRGVPDISAMANNTIVNETFDGSNSNDYAYWGTSVASPVEAGIVAEMDAVLNHYNESNLGYLNPMLYKIANEQVTSMNFTNTTGYIQTGQDNSTLPLMAFYNVAYGRNHVNRSQFGYDLVTGWGSIDAYNLTMYNLNVNYSGQDFALSGVENVFNLSGLNVTSYLYDSSTGYYDIVNNYFNASIQQNLFVADALGAPIYWIQNVIYINGSQETGWAMNYSGWVVYPFYGLYPAQTVYEYNYPLGKIVDLPHEFSVKTWLSNLSTLDGQTMNFEVNSHTLQIPVPGASFIIGSYNYTYFWQGKEYSNGPYPGNSYLGGLDPQFGLVGGPSGGLGDFMYPTMGNMTAYIQPMGQNDYIPASTAAFNISVDQTGEISYNLQWVKTGSTRWDLSIQNGSYTQGVLSYFPKTYGLTFSEYNLPAGTMWYVNLSDGLSHNTTSSTMQFQLPNGTYSFSVATILKIYSAPGSTAIINGNGVDVQLVFQYVTYQASFLENGLPQGDTWYVNITGEPGSGPLTTVYSYYTFSTGLHNGTYTFTISTSDKLFEPSTSSGTFQVNGATISESVTFSAVAYQSTFEETGLPSGTPWYVNVTGLNSHESSSNSISLGLQNGTYTYSVATANKDYSTSDSSGTLTVNGGTVSKEIYFSAVFYNISLKEANLPAGLSWTASLNGNSHSASSSEINFSVTNGTYTILVSNMTDYYTNDHSISVEVHGKNVTESVTFQHYAYITGTLSPGNALLTINGRAVSLTGGEFNVSVTAGNYTVHASLQGYNSYSTNVSIGNGQVKELNITLASSSRPMPADEFYAIIGGSVVVVAGIGSYLAIRSRKH